MPCCDDGRKKHQTIVDELIVAESSLPDLAVALQHPNEEFLAVAKFSLPELIFPETAKTFCDHATSQIHVYTDGSCKHQPHITSRFATYCVVIGWCQSDAERLQDVKKFWSQGKCPLPYN